MRNEGDRVVPCAAKEIGDVSEHHDVCVDVHGGVEAEIERALESERLDRDRCFQPGAAEKEALDPRQSELVQRKHLERIAGPAETSGVVREAEQHRHLRVLAPKGVGHHPRHREVVSGRRCYDRNAQRRTAGRKAGST